jgi:hypothetical protein
MTLREAAWRLLEQAALDRVAARGVIRSLRLQAERVLDREP